VSRARDELVARRVQPAEPRLMRADGIRRTDKEQRDLDRMFASTFSPENPASLRVLEYLEVITVRAVLGPEQGDAALRHMEGMRALYALIKNSVDRGRAG
jgi:hypothetical protein